MKLCFRNTRTSAIKYLIASCGKSIGLTIQISVAETTPSLRQCIHILAVVALLPLRSVMHLNRLFVALVRLGARPFHNQAKPLNVPVVYYKLPNGLKVVISEDHDWRRWSRWPSTIT